MKKLALFDVDGVIYDGNAVFDSINDQEQTGIIPKGTSDKILFITSQYNAGIKNYKEAANEVLDTYASALKGVNYKDILDHKLKDLKKNKDKFFPYFAKVVPQLKNKCDIYFVTTNFQFMCDALGKIFGVKNYLSSIAEVKDGKFTGKVERSLAGNKGIVADLISKYGKEGSFAVGDSENDADMLNKVEFPFVIEPNPKLEIIAKENGWQIVNRDTIQEKLLSLV